MTPEEITGIISRMKPYPDSDDDAQATINQLILMARTAQSETPDETAALRRVIENQDRALAHWRRKSDEDAGRMARYVDALRRIGHDPGEDKPMAYLWEIAREALAGELIRYTEPMEATA